MALYLIGDLQGCDAALAALLAKIDFSPSRDTIYVLGDLVNRGPDSAGTLRRLMAFGDAAQCLLGNHDLHLLALASGAGRTHPSDTLADLLAAPDCPALLDWLRHRPLALHKHGILMVHAGVLPQWDAPKTVALGGQLALALRGKDHKTFFHHMYGNQPDHWSDDLAGQERLRVIANALTRLRFCTADGRMEFATKGNLDAAPPGHMPWFDVPGRATAGTTIAFGHWSTLSARARTDVLAMDTGCVWGGALSALKLAPRPEDRELIQVDCSCI